MTPSSILDIIEKKVAKYIGTKHAIVCTSARNAIRFSLLALRVGISDEVIVPNLACEILPITVFCAGTRPRFCDIDRRTGSMTLTSLNQAIRPNTKAAILIHPFGFPTDAFTIREFAEEKNILLIEDAAQSLGASINHNKTGSIGHIGILSFHKFLNCNLGGAALTNDAKLADKIRTIRAEQEQKTPFASLGCGLMKIFKLDSTKNMRRILLLDNTITRRSESITTKRVMHYEKSWTKIDPKVFKMWHDTALTSSVINKLMTYGETYWHRRKMEHAELLLLNSEFDNLKTYIQHRRNIAKNYDEALDENGIAKPLILPGAKPSFLNYPLLVHDMTKLKKLKETLNKMGFNVQAYCYKPLHQSPSFGSLNTHSCFPDSTYVSEHILPLPILPEMSPNCIVKISSVLNA